MVAMFPAGADAQNLNCFDNLIFGQIITCGAPGTVTVEPDNSQSETCVTASGPFSRARCVATQSFPYRPFQIQITTTNPAISNGAQTMTITDFNVITNNGGPSATVSAAPFVSIPVGATLNVGATQASGTYTGTFVISVILQ